MNGPHFKEMLCNASGKGRLIRIQRAFMAYGRIVRALECAFGVCDFNVFLDKIH